MLRSFPFIALSELIQGRRHHRLLPRSTLQRVDICVSNAYIFEYSHLYICVPIYVYRFIVKMLRLLYPYGPMSYGHHLLVLKYCTVQPPLLPLNLTHSP